MTLYEYLKEVGATTKNVLEDITSDCDACPFHAECYSDDSDLECGEVLLKYIDIGQSGAPANKKEKHRYVAFDKWSSSVIYADTYAALLKQISRSDTFYNHLSENYFIEDFVRMAQDEDFETIMGKINKEVIELNYVIHKIVENRD